VTFDIILLLFECIYMYFFVVSMSTLAFYDRHITILHCSSLDDRHV